jgi:predicted GNAT family acetyltransferase
MASTVRDNTEKHQFELIVDGHTALAAYRLKPGVITFTHTEVPAALGGRGIGSQLAKGALDQVRQRGLKVVPLCPFIKAYIEKHPEYQELLA